MLSYESMALRPYFYATHFWSQAWSPIPLDCPMGTTRRCTRLPQSHILKITVDWCHWSEKKRCMSGDLSSFAYFFPTASPLDGFSTFRRRMQCSYRISWNTRNDKSFKLTRDCVIDLSIIVTANMCSSIVIVLSDCELISQSWYFVKYIQYLEKIIFRK